MVRSVCGRWRWRVDGINVGTSVGKLRRCIYWGQFDDFEASHGLPRAEPHWAAAALADMRRRWWTAACAGADSLDLRLCAYAVKAKCQSAQRSTSPSNVGAKRVSVPPRVFSFVASVSANKTPDDANGDGDVFVLQHVSVRPLVPFRLLRLLAVVLFVLVHLVPSASGASGASGGSGDLRDGVGSLSSSAAVSSLLASHSSSSPLSRHHRRLLLRHSGGRASSSSSLSLTRALLQDTNNDGDQDQDDLSDAEQQDDRDDETNMDEDLSNWSADASAFLGTGESGSSSSSSNDDEAAANDKNNATGQDASSDADDSSQLVDASLAAEFGLDLEESRIERARNREESKNMPQGPPALNEEDKLRMKREAIVRRQRDQSWEIRKELAFAKGGPCTGNYHEQPKFCKDLANPQSANVPETRQERWERMQKAAKERGWDRRNDHAVSYTKLKHMARVASSQDMRAYAHSLGKGAEEMVEAILEKQGRGKLWVHKSKIKDKK
ncbi:hypothetical protein PPROV_000796300 [Pycnococcus provasolii]|uniref:Uncharacterized protein n=1 Tax=Pycnococcus provasolii TaxID=41880 RepID=A0A830HP44_9CHLO|nr:hypothetical protein PPROV_000796300 [Pycnococcus provasolii]